MMFLLDTNAISDWLAENELVIARFATEFQVVTSVVVMGELDFGVRRMAPGRRRTNIETRLKILWETIPVLPVDVAVGEKYGELRFELEQNGQRKDHNDLWLAATCLVHDAILVTRDTDFSDIPSLKLENWTLS